MMFDVEVVLDCISDAMQMGMWSKALDAARELFTWQFEGGFVPGDTITQALRIIDYLDASPRSETKNLYQVMDAFVRIYRERNPAPPPAPTVAIVDDYPAIARAMHKLNLR